MKAIRHDIARLQQNGITAVAFPRIGDPSVIPLWFGEGDIVTPDFIREEAKQALDDGQTFYVHTRGSQELRQAIKTYLDNLYGVDINPSRITVPGSTMLGIAIVVQMALSQDDEALLVSPQWPNIELACAVTGAKLNFVRQRETPQGWQLSVDEIIAAVTPNTKLIFVNSPCNPTGWVMPQDEQRKLLAYCRDNNLLLLADEVYHRFHYGMHHAPSFIEIAQDDDPIVIVNGFSKSWAMTGWRVGWVVAPAEQATHWTLLSECFATGATVFAQPACIAALTQGEQFVSRLAKQYDQGRSLVMDLLGNHPAIEMPPPAGAFYAFPKIKGIHSSLKFAQQLLAEEDVGVAPGYTFGPDNEQHIRICFALSLERLEEGLKRIVKFIDRGSYAAVE